MGRILIIIASLMLGIVIGTMIGISGAEKIVQNHINWYGKITINDTVYKVEIE